MVKKTADSITYNNLLNVAFCPHFIGIRHAHFTCSRVPAFGSLLNGSKNWLLCWWDLNLNQHDIIIKYAK